MEHVERFIAYLTANRRGYEADIFTRKHITKPATLTVSGPAPADFLPEAPHPSISWSSPPTGTISQLFICTDSDAPLGAINHSIWFNIPPTITKVSADDVPKQDSDFKWGIGKNLMSAIYVPPRPLVGHGAHSYHYQVICLDKQLEAKKGQKLTETDILKQVKEENILAWGSWVGSCERTGSKK